MANPHPPPNRRGTTTTNLTPRTLYLTLYNTLLLALWLTTLINLLTLALSSPTPTTQTIFTTISPLARWTQTLALLEVVHSALGLVKAPVSTTAIQVFTRVIQVWMIWWGFPGTTGASRAFGVLVGAWAVADAVRYAYLGGKMWSVAPGWLEWVRYTMFIPLYPMGIGAEWWLMYKSVDPVGKISPVLAWFFYFLLALYVPGEYTRMDEYSGMWIWEAVTDLFCRRIHHVHVHASAETQDAWKEACQEGVT